MGNRVARAAGKKKSKRVKRGVASRTRPARLRAGAKRRTTAKRKRSARPAAKSARRGAARTTRARAGARTRAKGAARKRSGVKRTAIARATLRKRAPARPASSRHAAATPEPHPPSAGTRGAFAAQRALATAREELLFELQRSRASVKAATQGLTAASAERPIAPGKWTIKEIVLHLSERDRVRLEEFSRTLGGQPRTWAGVSDEEQTVVNETHLAPLRAHSWESAVRRLDSQRELLLLRLSEVPAHPDDVWRRGHPFADMMWGLPEHDRHHAKQIKKARIGELVPVEE